MTTLVNLASKLPRSALRLNSTEVAVEASWLFSSCSNSSSSFSSSPSGNKKIYLLSYSYSFTFAFFSSSKYLMYKEVTGNTQNLCRLCYNPTIMIRSFHIIPAKKWNDPPNIWCWCLSDPQPCSSSFSWSLLPLGITFLRYGKRLKHFWFVVFADRHKTAPHYWTLRTPYFASWEASLSCRVPVFPNRLGPLAPSKGFGIATWICCFHLADTA